MAEAVNRLVDAYFAHYRDQPDALAVWAGAQSDHGLRELDLEDTRSTAEFLVPPLLRILGRRRCATACTRWRCSSPRSPAPPRASRWRSNRRCANS